MHFDDVDVKGVDPTTQDGLCDLLQHLCGEAISLKCTGKKPPCDNCQACVNWSVLANRLKSPTLSLEDLNDILLLLEQFPIGEAFFEFFLSNGEKTVTFEELKQGIVKFKGYALLKYGNVRFGYRALYKLPRASFGNELGRWHIEPTILKKQYGARRTAPSLPEPIAANSTWLLGYIAKGGADRDLATYAAMAALISPADEVNILGKFSFNDEQKALYEQRKPFLQSNANWNAELPDLNKIENAVSALATSLRDVRRRGWRNTSHYLASDCMDVYVATSMRERWEFEDVHKVVNSVFSDARLAKLKLRYFDPTQSFLDNRVDKGLVEALMLKRSECTVYLVQETDTFGKDSELATTLAQGKPVIAYVPKIELESFSKVAEQRPLSYLQKRLSQLAAEDKIPAQHTTAVYTFLAESSGFQPFYRIVGDEEASFLNSRNLVESKKRMCEILAQAEKKLFDSRAETLQKRHPLSLQVQLQSGVANGVLVVRSEAECADLLSRLLTNQCRFRFESKREDGVTCLVEAISDSPFRVVTHNTTLTNAFWSLYNTA
jgi:hypothetical protein